ncbi:Histidine kinase-, DNA gyrase B-, and HSP90-like ATPase [compost metagenome]
MIEIVDNGPGIPKEKIDSILGDTGKNESPSRFSGMGVRNVHERIRIMYGEPYGIQLFSEEGLYTKVVIRFPQIDQVQQSPREVS